MSCCLALNNGQILTMPAFLYICASLLAFSIMSVIGRWFLGVPEWVQGRNVLNIAEVNHPTRNQCKWSAIL